MHINALDLSSFENVIQLLDDALRAYSEKPDNDFICDASIQRFKCTYELSHKMLKRYLKMTEPNVEEIDQMPFSNLIRTGSEKGLLLNGWDEWNKYRHARNLTSHTYDESKAQQVCDIIPQFLNDAQYLLGKLQERISRA